MLSYLKLSVPPTLGAWQLVVLAIPSAGSFAALVGCATIVGAALMVGRYKSAADAAERLLKLAAEETTIKDGKIARLESENAIFRAQPNLEQHARLLQKMLDKADQQLEGDAIQTDLLREIRLAVIPPKEI